MVLGANILNSDASLNDYFQISSLDFVPGSQAVLVIQLQDLQKELRYIPPVTATLTFTFNNVDGSNFTVPGAILDASDRSLWTVTLTGAQTTNLLSGNFYFSLDVLDDETNVIKALVNNGIRSLLVEC